MSHEAANDYYDELLASPAQSETIAAFAEAANDPKLRYRERSCCDVLRPLFFGASEYAKLQATTARIIDAFKAFYEALRANPALQKALGVPRRLVESEHNPPTYFSPLWQRFDGFISPDGELRMVELNPFPGGAFQHDWLVELYERLPIMAPFKERFRVRAPRTMPRLNEALRPVLPVGDSRTIANLGVIYFGEPKRVGPYLLDEPFFIKEHVAARGGQIVGGDLDEYRMVNDRLVLHDVPIDLLLPGNMLEVATQPEDHPVRVALRTGRARLITNFLWGMICTNKAVFEALTDPALAEVFGRDLFAFLQQHVPWTRLLRERTTSVGTETVDLFAYVRQHQSSLVIKPCGGQSGEGVVLGWEVSAQAWQEAIDRATKSPHIVQARVETERTNHPVLRDGAIVEESRLLDFDPYVFESTGADGALVRTSRGDLTNVGAGGTKTALFVVD